jgi:hypothetical protein
LLSFLSGKRGRGKKEVAATVLIKTIKYYENMKYTLKKVINHVLLIYIQCYIFNKNYQCILTFGLENLLPSKLLFFFLLYMYVANSQINLFLYWSYLPFCGVISLFYIGVIKKGDNYIIKKGDNSNIKKGDNSTKREITPI